MCLILILLMNFVYIMTIRYVKKDTANRAERRRYMTLHLLHHYKIVPTMEDVEQMTTMSKNINTRIRLKARYKELDNFFIRKWNKKLSTDELDLIVLICLSLEYKTRIF